MLEIDAELFVGCAINEMSWLQYFAFSSKMGRKETIGHRFVTKNIYFINKF